MTNHILLAAEIVSALAVLSGLLAAVVKAVKWFRRIVEGERCHLRSAMVQIYYNNKDTKTIRQYEKENFVKLFDAYKALEGNSFIDDINTEVRKWEVIT